MFEVQMLVPTAGNDGGVFGSEHVAAFGFAKSLFAQEAIALRYLGQFEVCLLYTSPSPRDS